MTTKTTVTRYAYVDTTTTRFTEAFAAIELTPATSQRNLKAILTAIEAASGHNPLNYAGNAAQPRWVFDHRVCLTLREAVTYAWDLLSEYR